MGPLTAQVNPPSSPSVQDAQPQFVGRALPDSPIRTMLTKEAKKVHDAIVLDATEDDSPDIIAAASAAATAAVAAAASGIRRRRIKLPFGGVEEAPCTTSKGREGSLLREAHNMDLVTMN